MSTSSCLSCSRMRDELSLVRHQLSSQRSVNGATTIPQFNSETPTTPVPPLMYQLQKGQQPAPSPTRHIVPTLTRSPPSASPTRLNSSVAKSKSGGTTAASITPNATAKKKDVHDEDSQTIVTDLAQSALVGSPCGKCICCALSAASHESFISVRDDWRARYEAAVEANRKLESENGQLATRVRSLRAELQAATSETKPVVAMPSITPLSSLNVDQEKIIRQLRQQHTADQHLLERLQLQINQLQQRTAASVTIGVSSSNSLDGLSALQRHQRDIREGAEQALLKLQQIFPDQKIGT